MSQLPGVPTKLTMQKRAYITETRKEYGMHIIFNEPFDASQRDFRIEFKDKCKKESKITLVVQIINNKHMEICYEAIDDSNKYFYIRRDPEDDQLHVGSKHLQYKNHHRYDIPLKNTAISRGEIHILQLEWKSNDIIEFSLDHTALVSSAVSGQILKDCARLVPGVDTQADTTKMMHGFIVYEVHHTSSKQMTLTELNHSYLLPAQYVVGAGGIVRFTGKCIMRETPTGQIRVSYGGKIAAQLKGLQRNKEMTVVILIHANQMTISLLGAPNPAAPVAVTMERNTADNSIKAIEVSRNLQTHTLEIVSVHHDSCGLRQF
ncbi:hypothetical protein HPB50_019764 [Hyalomma asiaticum]|uniref:Uncharacterized protein n=1 Tax=Hyalomma asiaticum TaxID=266040 RepID=A0ACB7S083_HYAAI|nr:hypothetical protein HPB50_019764 [Hyalomma asiaticum]